MRAPRIMQTFTESDIYEAHLYYLDDAARSHNVAWEKAIAFTNYILLYPRLQKEWDYNAIDDGEVCPQVLKQNMHRVEGMIARFIALKNKGAL